MRALHATESSCGVIAARQLRSERAVSKRSGEMQTTLYVKQVQENLRSFNDNAQVS
jgi:hypothetical protein